MHTHDWIFFIYPVSRRPRGYFPKWGSAFRLIQALFINLSAAFKLFPCWQKKSEKIGLGLYIEGGGRGLLIFWEDRNYADRKRLKNSEELRLKNKSCTLPPYGIIPLQSFDEWYQKYGIYCNYGDALKVHRTSERYRHAFYPIKNDNVRWEQMISEWNMVRYTNFQI